MAFAAADVRVFYILVGFCAVSGHVDPFVEPEQTRFDVTREDHVWAGISPDYLWHRASFAVFDFPGGIGITNQTAFFMMPATVVIAIKKWTLFSGCGYFHGFLT